jgi:hypothetical protein
MAVTVGELHHVEVSGVFVVYGTYYSVHVTRNTPCQGGSNQRRKSYVHQYHVLRFVRRTAGTRYYTCIMYFV